MGHIVELCVDTTLLTRAAWRDLRFSLPLRQADLDAVNAEFSLVGVRARIEGWLSRVCSA